MISGQHRIDISFAGSPVQGSPFFTEVYDPSQVRIGPLPRDIIVGTETLFDIQLENAGNVPLEVRLVSPSGVNGMSKKITGLDSRMCTHDKLLSTIFCKFLM